MTLFLLEVVIALLLISLIFTMNKSEALWMIRFAKFAWRRPKTVLLAFALLSAAALPGCQTVQTDIDNAANAGSTIGADIASVVTLNTTILNQVAAANQSNTELQLVVSKIKAGQALTAAEATVLSTGLSSIKVIVDASALVGKTLGAQVTAAAAK